MSIQDDQRATYNAFAAHGILPSPPDTRTILEIHSDVFHVPSTGRTGDGFTQDAEALEAVKALGNAHEFNDKFLGVIECGEFPSGGNGDIMRWDWTGKLLAVVRVGGVGVWGVDAKQWVADGLRGVQGILCVAFRPWGGNMIAAGCEKGVALWVVGTGKVIWLEQQGMQNVSGVEWSPDGRWLTAVTRERSAIVLWDVGTRAASVVGKGGGVVRFSPGSGRYLFGAGGEVHAFRLWDTAKWKMQKFTVRGSVKAAAWAGDASMLAVGCQNEEAIHVLRVNSGNEEDLAYTIFTETTGLPEVGTGGDVEQMAWDPTGERLAVAFSRHSAEHEEEFLESNLVALYGTSSQSYFRLSPMGYIRGPLESGKAVSLQFHPKPQEPMGAILAIAWAGGCISFVQLAFFPEMRAKGLT